MTTVSVIVPAYNAASTIEACVRACREQTRAPLEVIVVDDGSSDDTARIAEEAGATVIRKGNGGPAAERFLPSRIRIASRAKIGSRHCSRRLRRVSRRSAGPTTSRIRRRGSRG